MDDEYDDQSMTKMQPTILSTAAIRFKSDKCDNDDIKDFEIARHRRRRVLRRKLHEYAVVSAVTNLVYDKYHNEKVLQR
eukprot:11755235-Karenia_brevis.AAC.1